MRYRRWSAGFVGIFAAALIATTCAKPGGRAVDVGSPKGATRNLVVAYDADSAQEPDPPGMAALGKLPSITLDSALSRPQPKCDVPLTGLLHTDREHGRRWQVRWSTIMAHIRTLDVERDLGERDHVLKPVQPGGDVKASIASIKGTEMMSDKESLEALRCGKVIARIISDGDHLGTKIYRDTNYLVIALQSDQWVFVILNPNRNYRASLSKFKYTPHYRSYGDPTITPEGQAIRDKFPAKGLSIAAQDCLANGFKACFIDPPPGGRRRGFGPWLNDALTSPMQSIDGSQPWIPCPLYGCCCGGDECHERG